MDKDFSILKNFVANKLRPQITMETVMLIYGLHSKSHAHKLLQEWEAEGLVVHEKGLLGKGKWYIK